MTEDATLVPDLPEPAKPAAPTDAFPPSVNDFGLVELELMGHRYRVGHLSEVVIAGQPFLRLTTKDGRSEYYRPDAVYCLTPVPEGAEPKPRAAIPSGWGSDWDCPEDSVYDDINDDDGVAP